MTAPASPCISPVKLPVEKEKSKVADATAAAKDGADAKESAAKAKDVEEAKKATAPKEAGAAGKPKSEAEGSEAPAPPKAAKKEEAKAPAKAAAFAQTHGPDFSKPPTPTFNDSSKCVHSYNSPNQPGLDPECPEGVK